jgi:hypothetical protein
MYTTEDARSARRTGNTVLVILVSMVLIGLDYAHIVTWAQWLDFLSQTANWIVGMIG